MYIQYARPKYIDLREEYSLEILNYRQKIEWIW